MGGGPDIRSKNSTGRKISAMVMTLDEDMIEIKIPRSNLRSFESIPKNPFQLSRTDRECCNAKRALLPGEDSRQRAKAGRSSVHVLERSFEGRLPGGAPSQRSCRFP